MQNERNSVDDANEGNASPAQPVRDDSVAKSLFEGRILHQNLSRFSAWPRASAKP